MNTFLPPEQEKQLDEILLNFAKRIESMPRGKTYGWDEERTAITTLLLQQQIAVHDTARKTSADNGASSEGMRMWHAAQIGILQTHLKELEQHGQKPSTS